MAAVGRVAWRRYQRWRLHASLLDKINDDYERIRSARKDVVYHYYWALDRGEPTEATCQESKLVRVCVQVDSSLTLF